MSTDDPRTPELPDDMADDGVDAELASTLRRSLHEAADAVEPTATWANVASRLDDDARHPRWVTAPRALVAVAAAAALLLGAISVLGDSDADQTLDVGGPSTTPPQAAERSIVAVQSDGSIVLLHPSARYARSEAAGLIELAAPRYEFLSTVTFHAGGWSVGDLSNPEQRSDQPLAVLGEQGEGCGGELVLQQRDLMWQGPSNSFAEGLFSPAGDRFAYVSYGDPVPSTEYREDPTTAASSDGPGWGITGCTATFHVVDADGSTWSQIDAHTVDPALRGPGNWPLPNDLLWSMDGARLGFTRSYESAEPFMLDPATGEERSLAPDAADVPERFADRSWRLIGLADADTWWLQGECSAECSEAVNPVLFVDAGEVTVIERPPDEIELSVDPASGRLLYATATDIECVEAPCEALRTWWVAPSISSDDAIELEDVVVAAWGPSFTARPATDAPSTTIAPTTPTTVAPAPAPGVVVAPVGPCPPGGLDVPATLPPQPQLPKSVAAMRDRIYGAARACDWDALEALMGEGFMWSWRDDPGAAAARSGLEHLQVAADATGEPGPLQLIVGLLSLDPVERMGTWAWPAQRDWKDDWPVEGIPDLADLTAVVGDEAVAKMLELQTYVSWSLLIDEDGTWNAFIDAPSYVKDLPGD